MKKYNILFSTTRQFNSGDEFIYFGIRNLLDEIGIKYNPIIFNRHPTITPSPRERVFTLNFVLKYLDNSWDRKSNEFIDYVIFAGSPGWVGRRFKSLYNLIQKQKLRCSYLGVGGLRNLSKQEKEVIKNNADILIARDNLGLISLKEFGGIKLSCPALFSCKNSKVREKINKIGIVFQKMDNFIITKDIYENYKNVIKKYICEIICHNYEDFKIASKLFPNNEINYSSYSENYEEIYDKFDLIISPRVHGCGIASSLGIPSILIKHDMRSETAKGFLSEIIAPNKNLINVIKKLNINKRSIKIIKHKKEEKEKYKKLLKDCFK